MNDDLKRLRARVNGMRQEREPYESVWRDVASYVVPGCTAFPEEFSQRGGMGDEAIINDTPTIAHRALASGMQAGLTSPSRPWFKLSTPDMALAEFEPVKQWLSYVESVLYEIFARSNFYDATYSFYEQLCGPGTAAMGVEKDFHRAIRCSTYDVGSYWISNGKGGNADVFVRCTKMTAEQMASAFGVEKCSHAVRNAYEHGNYDAVFTVWYCVAPNGLQDPTAMGWRRMKYRAVYWEDGENPEDFLSVSGCEEFPVMVARWSRGDGRVYGRSPAWTALGDCKMLQSLEQSIYLGLDRLVDPPLIAPSALDGGKLHLLPGAVSYFDETQGNSSLRSVYEGISVPVQYMDAKVSMVSERIKSTFFNDLFMMMTYSNNTAMTAREITERHEEKLLMLGPVVMNTKSELLDPCIDRVFGIAMRSGLIPPPPEELQSVPLKVDYISILAQAQKMVGLSAMNELVAMTAALVQVGKPDAVDKLDGDQLLDEAGRMLGVPAGVVLSDDSVAETRAARAQQQQMMQAQAAMQQAPEAAKTLSDTPIGNGSALDALLSMGGGGGSL